MIQLKYCAIEWTELGCRTVFPDGSEIDAWPHPELNHYHVISHRCGYGDNLTAYCRDHDLAHAVIAELLLDRESCALHAQAHGVEPERGMALLEELAAQALQRWARAAERPIVAGFDWDRLRAEFLRYADELDASVSRETSGAGS